jgi:hypothetical protein
LLKEPRVAVWRLMGLFAGTCLMAHGFGLWQADHGTNIRYYLPALVLLAAPVAMGLDVLVSWLPWLSLRRLVLALVVLAAPMSCWGLLKARWAAGEEFRFAARELARIPDECTILTRAPGELGALELSQELSASLGRKQEWRQVGPGEGPVALAPEPACNVYYRGGRCAIGRWSLGREDVAEDCGRLESGWRLTPIAEAWISGEPLVSETYRTMPYQVGFYKISSGKWAASGRPLPQSGRK